MSYLHLDDSETKAKWRKWFQGANFGKRVLLAVVFVLGLASFLHFREIPIEIPELNSTAENYIIAQTDFEFLDVDAMMILKQEQVQDIGTVYKISLKQISRYSAEFSKYLSENPSWRDKSGAATSIEIHEISEALEKALKKWRFTDKRTIKKIKDLPTFSSYYYPLSRKETTEELLPEEFWKLLKSTNLSSYPEAATDLPISYFSHKKWALEEDLSRQIELRQTLEENIPKKYTKFEEGKRILDAGDKVTSRHIVILNAMKSALAKKRNLWEPKTILASLSLAILLTVIPILYLRKSFKSIFFSLKKMTLLVAILLFTFGIAKGVEALLFKPSSHLLDMVHYPILVPFTTILVTVLFGRKVALFCLSYVTVILTICLAFPYGNFLIANLVLGLVSILYSKAMHNRRDIFVVCGKIWFWSVLLIAVLSLGEHIGKTSLFWDTVSSFGFLLGISLLVIGFLPLIESLFDVITDMSLIEYMDPNNELLRRLSLELPGTYQHCLVVGNLAEAAALAIGANGLFCRVSSLYHDIGKLSNPHYFTENQLGGFNIHQLLTPIESSQVIMAHVHDGEMLARKHHLPQGFIDIIKEHHGTTLVYYFYRKYLDQKSPNSTENNEFLFRYNGPKPKTKESAIIMIADSVEATSRSLDEISEKAIVEIVDRVVREKAEDGQLDECELTFEELGIVKKSIVKTLVVTLHLRVKYPKKNETQRIPIDGC